MRHALISGIEGIRNDPTLLVLFIFLTCPQFARIAIDSSNDSMIWRLPIRGNLTVFRGRGIMSRATLLGAFVFVVAGLSGCASPAHLVKVEKDLGRVIVAVPEDTNTWPYYYRDEATIAASAQIPEPELKKVTRVKVGEQLTNTQDSTRRDLGGDKDKPKVGEVVTSTNTTSVSDKYEYHMEYESANSKKPNFLSNRPSLPTTPAPTPGGPPLDLNPVTPVGGIAPRGEPTPADGIRAPSVVPPATQANVLPSTYIPEPGRR